MQPQIERRSHAQRVPMDQGVVEVSFVEYGETAPADAVNIAEGGLSLRASILPEVGTEMRCAFPMPDGHAIEADCRVVWAQHSGPYAGEFGLRFVDIGRLDEERIRDYVDAQRARGGYDDSVPDESDGGYVDDSDPGYAARVADAYDAHESIDSGTAVAKPSAIPDTIRLHIDGVTSPVAASVVQATHDALVVEQELSFLSLGTRIAAVEGGPKGALSSVELRVVDGAPRLVLTVLFGDAAELPAEAPDAVEASAPSRVYSDTAFAKTELRGALDTLPDADADADADATSATALPPEPVAANMALEDARHSSIPPARMVDARPSHGGAASPVAPRNASVELQAPALDARQPSRSAHAVLDDGCESGHEDELDALLDGASHVRREPAPPGASGGRRTSASADEDSAAASGDSPVDRLSHLLRTRTKQLSERAAPLQQRARELSAQGARGALPALKALLARVVLLLGTLRQKAMPALTRVARQARATMTQLRTGQAPRATKSGRPLRRQQSRLGASVRPAPAHTARSERDALLDPQRARRRTIVLSTLAFVLVAITVWALAPDDTPTVDAAAPDAAPSASSAPPVAAPAPSTTAVSPYVSPTPEPTPAPLAAAASPAAPSGPTPGPLAEPTYPSLGDERPQSPGSVPADSPYAEGETAGGAVHEGRTFGAESVSRARTFEITMSQRVEMLRGRAEGNGFVVDIPGALAMSGARTISRNHPMVARSHILNHGDHSTLTVEFVAGQSPAYRVSSRGTALQIEIER